jgi:hypothetical protein
LLIDLLLGLGNRFNVNFAGTKCWLRDDDGFSNDFACFVNYNFTKMISRSMDVFGNLGIFFFHGLRLNISKVRDETYDKKNHTETINIMASFSLESSLHALVNIGSPIGTNTKPGGGSESFVT